MTTTIDRYEGRTRAADGWRWCSRCHIYQPRDAFHRNAARRDGLAHNCRACLRDIRRATYLKRREREIAAALAWQQAHPDAARAAHRRADRVYDLLHADQRRAAALRRRAPSPIPEMTKQNESDERHDSVSIHVSTHDLPGVR